MSFAAENNHAATAFAQLRSRGKGEPARARSREIAQSKGIYWNVELMLNPFLPFCIYIFSEVECPARVASGSDSIQACIVIF